MSNENKCREIGQVLWDIAMSKERTNEGKVARSKSLESESSCWNGRQHCTCVTTVCTGVGKRLHTLPSHPTLGEPQGFGTLTNKQTPGVNDL